MFEELKYCKGTTKNYKRILLKGTHHVERNFEMVSKSHICNKLYTEKNLRVRDHSHITGKYRRFCSSNLLC